MTLKSSTVSFKDAANNMISTSVPAVLDLIHSKISTYNSGVITLNNGGPNYSILLMKSSDIYYAGLVVSYGNTGIAHFRFNNGTYLYREF